ncbi:hypothetical protein DLE60_25340 [Micromonospora globispora]|uniref:Uncharacterized protein n=1 Tax=Micromonospora globispora TaxID=1450148 RepID=A0A317K3E6_9ACTN|nr:hypothetical protein DLJ46_14315 [Micromonospora globispora]PWU56991.1 hypothetical protein DLE60_25340 [Micromonospora globispora]RQW95488.1 hypothetical protein DKL51_14850 [Micromonospora globispora]
MQPHPGVLEVDPGATAAVVQIVAGQRVTVPEHRLDLSATAATVAASVALIRFWSRSAVIRLA